MHTDTESNLRACSSKQFLTVQTIDNAQVAKSNLWMRKRARLMQSSASHNLDKFKLKQDRLTAFAFTFQTATPAFADTASLDVSDKLGLIKLVKTKAALQQLGASPASAVGSLNRH
jgi:hypothetical protein